MTVPSICATPGCHNPVAARPRTGRPPIYCSPACRPARKRQRQPPQPAGDDPEQINVDIAQDPDAHNRPGRSWTVTLRRGPHQVVIGHNLGRFTATALTDDVRELLHHQGGPID